MADDDPDSVHRRGEPVQGGRAIAEESVAQQQVLGRVAAQRQLGCKQNLRASGFGALGAIQNFGGVPRKVAEYAVHLRDGDFDRVAHRRIITLAARRPIANNPLLQ